MGKGGWPWPPEAEWKKQGSEVWEQEKKGGTQRNGWSWELPCWRAPYSLSVCHGISRPNKEEFK